MINAQPINFNSMNRNTALISLPKELVSLLLTNWLGWRDIGHFDSAICNRAARKEWIHLLSTICIFDSVSAGFWQTLNYFPWVLLRFVRTRMVVVRFNPHVEETLMARWLEHTGPYLASFTSNHTESYVLRSLTHNANSLKVLSFRNCNLDDIFWTFLRSNPHLQELSLFGKSVRTDPVPTDMYLPNLHRLDIGCDTLSSESSVLLMRQLPSLRSLKLAGSDIAVAIETLFAVIPPKLVNLHLESPYQSITSRDYEQFQLLMERLAPGLRSVVLLVSNDFTVDVLQSVVQYHGHSLRGLCLIGNVPLDLPLTSSLSDLLNQMPYLHTLQIPFRMLSKLTAQVNNPIITHLYVDLTSHYEILADSIKEHFPHLTKLSLFWTSVHTLNSDIIVPNLARLVNRRPALRTICLKNEELIKEMRWGIPKCQILKYTPFDIFSLDF